MLSIEQQLQALEEQLKRKCNEAEKEKLFVEAGNQRFKENLIAFQNYFPDIYEKFLTYNPTEKFQFILNPNGSVNIIDHDTGVPMYAEDPIEQCREQCQKNIDAPIIGRTDHTGVALIENVSDFRHVDLMVDLGTIYNKAKDNLTDNNKLGESIPSLMVFGVGLGYHLEQLIDATTSAYINIFEPNEDYFFASLFVCDWVTILNKIDKKGCYLYLGIGLSESEIYQAFYNRSRNISVATICHAWFYQHYPSFSVNKWIAEFKTNFHQFFAGFGFLDDAIMGVAHTLGNVKNELPMMGKFKTNDTIAQLPAFIIANGPSLDADIERIRALQNKAVIFSCNSASTALVKHGIVPDFHVALERTKSTYTFLKEHLPEHARAKMNLLTTNVMHPDVSQLFNWTGMGLKSGETGTQMLQVEHYYDQRLSSNTLSFCNPLVGNTALSFACHLGFKEIYLFGVDNGFIDEAHHHSKSSFYYDEKGDTVVKPYRHGKNIALPGNFVERVLTDEFMHVGKVQMDRLLKSFENTGLNCYNASNGVAIENTIPLHSEDILLGEMALEKAQAIEYIKSTCFDVKSNYDAVEAYLGYSDFNALCQTMSEILRQPFSNRLEAQNVLLQSLRYLYSFKDSPKHLLLYLLLEGEALYVTSLLISLLYNFGSDEEIVPYFDEAIERWALFIESAPSLYQEFSKKPK